MRIGIFGGSFNPVHNGHVELACEALSELNLKKIIFVPNRQNPLKPKKVLLPTGLRLRLLRAAIKPYRDFQISRREIDAAGPSFTVDTLRFFKKKFGEGATLYFLTGSDQVATFDRWKNWNEARRLARFVVAARPRFALKKIPRGVLTLSMKPMRISSTQIRSQMKLKKTLRGVPCPVKKNLEVWSSK